MIWWIIATICAYFVKGLCGFANTLIFTSILSFGNNNMSITPIELVLGYPTTLIVVWKERKSIKWNVCLPLIAFTILGMIPGVLFLKNVDATIVKIFFGIVIIFIGLEMLTREYQKKAQNQSKLLMAVIGIVSGLLCGMYGIGALLGAYVGRATEDSSSFKANLCAVFTVESTIRMILYICWGIITLDVVKQAIVLVPVMLISLFLGMYSTKFLDEKVIKKVIIIMLIVSGVALIINNL